MRSAIIQCFTELPAHELYACGERLGVQYSRRYTARQRRASALFIRMAMKGVWM
ncbi:MAG: hypothetical protein ACK4IT_02570 [Thioalkalivibrionaceae bacterium]